MNKPVSRYYDEQRDITWFAIDRGEDYTVVIEGYKGNVKWEEYWHEGDAPDMAKQWRAIRAVLFACSYMSRDALDDLEGVVYELTEGAENIHEWTRT